MTQGNGQGQADGFYEGRAGLAGSIVSITFNNRHGRTSSCLPLTAISDVQSTESHGIPTCTPTKTNQTAYPAGGGGDDVTRRLAPLDRDVASRSTHDPLSKRRVLRTSRFLLAFAVQFYRHPSWASRPVSPPGNATAPMAPCAAHPPLLSTLAKPARPTHTAGPPVAESDVGGRCPWGH